MAARALDSLAEAAGIAVHWNDHAGRARRLAADSLHALLDAQHLPSRSPRQCADSQQALRERQCAIAPLVTADAGTVVRLAGLRAMPMHGVLRDEEGDRRPLRIDEEGRFQAPVRHGYYRLFFGERQLELAVAPPQCFGVADALGQPEPHAWGLAAQVYALRRSGDGGLGDSSAVADIARRIGEAGGDALGLSPLHAAGTDDAHYSPYAPANRSLLDWASADPAQVLGAETWQQAIARAGVMHAWRQAESLPLIDWPAQRVMRRRAWQALHAQFAQAPGALRSDCAAFLARHGELLRGHATISARRDIAAARGESTCWTDWSGDWNSDDAPAARSFAATHPEAIEFEMFAQWLAACCWERTRRGARSAGLRIGLIGDLATGFAHEGSEAWIHRREVLAGLELGAPPDDFNATGQCWGVTSYSPWGLRASGFRPFIALLRAAMARGGGLRIDHIIGLARLWVVPRGQLPECGGYLGYPLEDLLRLLVLESWRHRCVVIGEDLGTVPAGLRARLAASGILGTDVLLFMRDADGGFLSPQCWRSGAMATTTTHDLPPVAAWLEGADIALRARAFGLPPSAVAGQRRARRTDVAVLGQAVSATGHSAANPQTCLAYTARSPSPLLLAPLEDVLGCRHQPNLPGTVDQHPNWRQRLPGISTDALAPGLRALAACRPRMILA